MNESYFDYEKKWGDPCGVFLISFSKQIDVMNFVNPDSCESGHEVIVGLSGYGYCFSRGCSQLAGR